jgi:YVTN family beta-propeller protein
VYVPNEGSNNVVVIDPATFRIIGRFQVGSSPEHVTPDWDLKLLYVGQVGCWPPSGLASVRMV